MVVEANCVADSYGRRMVYQKCGDMVVWCFGVEKFLFIMAVYVAVIDRASNHFPFLRACSVTVPHLKECRYSNRDDSSSMYHIVLTREQTI